MNEKELDRLERIADRATQDQQDAMKSLDRQKRNYERAAIEARAAHRIYHDALVEFEQENT